MLMHFSMAEQNHIYMHTYIYIWVVWCFYRYSTHLWSFLHTPLGPCRGAASRVPSFHAHWWEDAKWQENSVRLLPASRRVQVTVLLLGGRNRALLGPEEFAHFWLL